MQRRPPTSARTNATRVLTRSTITAFASLLLVLPLSACDLWPFDDEPKHQQSGAASQSPFARSAATCPTACAMASASKHELKLLLGTDKLPAELEWGRPYVDGAGFQAFNACVGQQTDDSERTAECLQVAHTACIKACEKEETARLTRKSARHQGRDEARKKARQKKATPQNPSETPP